VVELPAWIGSTKVQVGFGFRDNVLLAHVNEERSTFVRAGVDALFLHPAKGRADYVAALKAAGSHYFTAQTVNEDSYAMLLGQWNYRVFDSLKFSLGARAYSVEQIYDVSNTELLKVVTQTKLVGASAGPELRWDFARSWWVAVETAGARENSPNGFYNRTVAEGVARFGWKPTARFQAILSAGDRVPRYDNREQYSRAGRPVAGTRLRMKEREADLRFIVILDAAEHWRADLRLSTAHLKDNGAGFWSYQYRRVAPELEWNSGAWLVRFEGIARRVDYDVQTVGFGLNPPPRVRDDYSGHLTVEREITPRWTVYTEYTWERKRSNDEFASYGLNEGLLGIRWNWVK
jgi:hypothetical protein